MIIRLRENNHSIFNKCKSTNNMFLFRKRQQASKLLPEKEKKDLSIIEKGIEVYVVSGNEDISQKIYQKLMEEKNNFTLIK